MLLIGLLLFGAAAAVAMDALIENTSTMSVLLFGRTFDVPLRGVLVIAAGVGLIAVLGVLFMRDAAARRARLRAERRDAMAARERLADLAEQERAERRSAETTPRSPRSRRVIDVGREERRIEAEAAQAKAQQEPELATSSGRRGRLWGHG